MAKRRTKPNPPSRVIKSITACNPSIQNIEKIIAGLTEWVNSVKDREIALIDEEIAKLNEKKAKLQKPTINERNNTEVEG